MQSDVVGEAFLTESTRFAVPPNDPTQASLHIQCVHGCIVKTASLSIYSIEIGDI